jgi:hypothetical protein
MTNIPNSPSEEAMATPTTSQPFVDHPADVASEQAREDLANLRAAYAALNDGHLWWKSHRTWNGPADVEAALAPQRSSSDTPRRQIHAGEPTRISGRFMVECHLIPPDDTSDTTRDEHGRDGAFYEVVTIRDGKIVRFADYRSRTIARGAATANY